MRKVLFSTVLASLPALGAGAAMAQSSADVTTYGFIEAGQNHAWNSSASTTKSYYIGDFGGSYSFGNYGGVDIGFDLGVLGTGSLDSGSSNKRAVVFGALSFGFGDSKVSVGAPRPAYDLAAAPFARGSGTGMISPDFYFYSLSVNNLARRQMSSDGESYGLRYDGMFSGAHVAASWNRVSYAGGAATFDTYGAAAMYPMGNMAFYGATEYSRLTGGQHLQQSTLGGTYDFGKGNAGLNLSYGNSVFSPSTNTTQFRGFVNYDATDRLTLSANTWGLTVTGTDIRAYGIGASYKLFSNAAITAGYTRADSSTGSPVDVTSIALNWSF